MVYGSLWHQIKSGSYYPFRDSEQGTACSLAAVISPLLCNSQRSFFHNQPVVNALTVSLSINRGMHQDVTAGFFFGCIANTDSLNSIKQTRNIHLNWPAGYLRKQERCYYSIKNSLAFSIRNHRAVVKDQNRTPCVPVFSDASREASPRSDVFNPASQSNGCQIVHHEVFKQARQALDNTKNRELAAAIDRYPLNPDVGMGVYTLCLKSTSYSVFSSRAAIAGAMTALDALRVKPVSRARQTFALVSDNYDVGNLCVSMKQGGSLDGDVGSRGNKRTVIGNEYLQAIGKRIVQLQSSKPLQSFNDINYANNATAVIAQCALWDCGVEHFSDKHTILDRRLQSARGGHITPLSPLQTPHSVDLLSWDQGSEIGRGTQRERLLLERSENQHPLLTALNGHIKRQLLSVFFNTSGESGSRIGALSQGGQSSGSSIEERVVFKRAKHMPQGIENRKITAATAGWITPLMPPQDVQSASLRCRHDNGVIGACMRQVPLLAESLANQSPWPIASNGRGTGYPTAVLSNTSWKSGCRVDVLNFVEFSSDRLTKQHDAFKRAKHMLQGTKKRRSSTVVDSCSKSPNGDMEVHKPYSKNCILLENAVLRGARCVMSALQLSQTFDLVNDTHCAGKANTTVMQRVPFGGDVIELSDRRTMIGSSYQPASDCSIRPLLPLQGAQSVSLLSRYQDGVNGIGTQQVPMLAPCYASRYRMLLASRAQIKRYPALSLANANKEPGCYISVLKQSEQLSGSQIAWRVSNKLTTQPLDLVVSASEKKISDVNRYNRSQKTEHSKMEKVYQSVNDLTQHLSRNEKHQQRSHDGLMREICLLKKQLSQNANIGIADMSTSSYFDTH